MFVIYICFIILISLLLYFGNSLESIQYYHCRIMNCWDKKVVPLKWVDNFNVDNSFTLLYLCVLSSVLYSGVFYIKKPDFLDKIEVLYGYSFTMKKTRVGYMFRHNDFLVIVLCSTSNLSDVSFSFLNNLISIDDGQIHEGYYIHTLEFFPNVLEILSKYSDVKKIFLTGHSLGGACSSILGYLLSKYFNYRTCVYAFGSPKFGNIQLKYKIEQLERMSIWNILNTADKIPDKPSNWKYTRIGKEIKFRLDTGNDNVNHGIRAYKEMLDGKCTIKKRKHRFDEILSRVFLDLLG